MCVFCSFDFSQIYRVAGPFGFFKGLNARVLYSMPATAICWSTYEFFKFMLSQKNQDDYRSTVSGKIASTNNNIDAKISDKKRTSLQDESANKPKRYVIATEIIADGTTLHHSSSSSSTDSASPPASTLLPAARELTSISGAGVYNALSLNSMHTETMYDPISRGCNR